MDSGVRQGATRATGRQEYLLGEKLTASFFVITNRKLLDHPERTEQADQRVYRIPDNKCRIRVVCVFFNYRLILLIKLFGQGLV